MTIQEAIRSRRKFRRSGDWVEKTYGPQTYKWVNPGHDYYQFKQEDLAADDWEIDEEKIEITRNQLIDALAQYNRACAVYTTTDTSYINLLKALGFKS